jgi:hypothetical protein
MKMGTIRSPWHYDAAARHALQSVNLRRPAILHYASCAAVFPDFQGGPVTPDSGRAGSIPGLTRCANSGLMHRSKDTVANTSFDHLVGTGEQRGRNLEA